MSAVLPMPEARPPWGIAGAAALVAHGVIGGLVLLWSVPAEWLPPEPAVLVELPPAEAPVTAAPIPEPAVTPPPARVPPPVLERLFDAPVVEAPLPRDVVSLPPPPEPPAEPSVEAPAETRPPPEHVADAVMDPKAQRQVADYFARLSAHLNRRKSYPVSAKKARQQGVVTVRFTVDRDGNVSSASIKQSSGHEILDQATLELLQRVAPLPRFPDSMQRDRLTLSLPIDYSLRTS